MDSRISKSWRPLSWWAGEVCQFRQLRSGNAAGLQFTEDFVRKGASGAGRCVSAVLAAHHFDGSRGLRFCGIISCRKRLFTECELSQLLFRGRTKRLSLITEASFLPV